MMLHRSTLCHSVQALMTFGYCTRLQYSLVKGASDDAQNGKFLYIYRLVMAKLAAALEGEGGGEWAGAEYVRIEGATDHRDRRAAATRFRDDPAVRVALLSVTAAGALAYHHWGYHPVIKPGIS